MNILPCFAIKRIKTDLVPVHPIRKNRRALITKLKFINLIKYCYIEINRLFMVNNTNMIQNW